MKNYKYSIIYTLRRIAIFLSFIIGVFCWFQGSILPQTNFLPVGGATNDCVNGPAQVSNDAPIIGNPLHGEPPLTVSFVASESYGNTASYSWNFGDGKTGSGRVIEHVFQIAAQYSISLTVTEDKGSSQKFSIEVLVENPEYSVGKMSDGPKAILLSSSTAGEAPLVVLFDGSGSLGDKDSLTYSWEFGDGTTGTGDFISQCYGTPATYMAILTVVDKTSISNTTNTQITVFDTPEKNLPPIVGFSMTQVNDMTPVTVLFDATKSTDPDGAIVSYDWNFGDGSYGSGQVITHTFTDRGEYAVELRVSDNRGVMASASIPVTAQYP